MARFADDIDITLLALVSHLQHRIFQLEGKTPQQTDRLTRRVVSLVYRMAFGESMKEQTHASIDWIAERLVAAVNALEDLIVEEETDIGEPDGAVAN